MEFFAIDCERFFSGCMFQIFSGVGVTILMTAAIVFCVYAFCNLAKQMFGERKKGDGK